MAAGILWCSCTASVSALPQKQSSMRDITTAQLVKDIKWETAYENLSDNERMLIQSAISPDVPMLEP